MDKLGFALKVPASLRAMCPLYAVQQAIRAVFVSTMENEVSGLMDDFARLSIASSTKKGSFFHPAATTANGTPALAD